MLKRVRELPSLDLLKGFEAAARNLSFTKAAAELFVTQSAISRQVQTLEGQLGVPLFRRHHRELRLTEEGQTFYKTTGEVLRLLRDVTGRLGARPAGMLTVTTTVSFAGLWLVPRLNDFRRLHPGIDMRLAATNEIQDLGREGIDLAIRYCTPKAAGRSATRLFGELVFPVCSKSALAGRKMKSPQDLWRSRFVSNWVKLGKLILPFGKRYMSSPADSRAYFIVPARGAARPEVAEFARWLLQQARAEDSDAALAAWVPDAPPASYGPR